MCMELQTTSRNKSFFDVIYSKPTLTAEGNNESIAVLYFLTEHDGLVLIGNNRNRYLLV